jgi:S-adenosylmethionine:tRNA ribosyltransferase-isomerase
MLLSDFDYELPDNLIAKHPAKPRDAAKLIVADRKSGKLTHSSFKKLPDFLRKDDFLVFNSSKVISARLFGKIDGRGVEVLLISPCHPERSKNGVEGSFSIGRKRLLHSSSGSCRISRNDKENIWQVIAKPGKRLKEGSQIKFNKRLSAKVLKSNGIKFNLSNNDFWKEIDHIGEIPLPPYILKARQQVDLSPHPVVLACPESTLDQAAKDKKDYQTVFAKKKGSIAAPTAGLHFTESLMQRIKDKGCDIGFVDLHAGLGTFEPIRTKNIEDHKIHSEYFELSPGLAKRLNQAKSDGRRIIAVGTTTVRVLETAFGLQRSDSCRATRVGPLQGVMGETDIYIYPGYKFRFVDGMITNFHLPKSSLLLLASAFWSREKIRETYKEAIKNNYRFYSYGDGMFMS